MKGLSGIKMAGIFQTEDANHQQLFNVLKQIADSYKEPQNNQAQELTLKLDATALFTSVLSMLQIWNHHTEDITFDDNTKTFTIKLKHKSIG